MSDKRVEAAAELLEVWLRGGVLVSAQAARSITRQALEAADAADDTHVRVPRQVAVDLYKMGGFLAEYEGYKGLEEPVRELGKALFYGKA